MEIQYDRSGNYADSIINATNGHDIEEWMSVNLDPHALARAQRLDATAGNDKWFLSFQQRVDWARSTATIEQAMTVIADRAARYARSEEASSIRVDW